MVTKWITKICGIIVLLVSAIGLWAHFQNQKANSIIDEANVLVEQANSFLKEATPIYQKLFTEEMLQGFPGNRAELARLGKEAGNKYQQAADYYRKSAVKLEEGVQTAASEIISQYWTILAKAHRKLAENKELAQRLVSLFADESIGSIDALNEKVTMLVDSIDKSSKEYDDLAAQAEKIKAEHPHDIK